MTFHVAFASAYKTKFVSIETGEPVWPSGKALGW